jgi:isoquinoline 1-oxidoreductase beta subunit
MKSSISRRDFLKGTLATAGLTIAASVTPFGYTILNAAEAKKGAFTPNVWLEVTPDNLVTITIPNSEMGQGIRTALSMMVADELEAEWGQIRVRQAPAADAFKNPFIYKSQLTVGSASVRGFYEPMRKAGAAGRMMLVKAAAKTWKVPEKECEANNGMVTHKKSGRRLAYGKLCKAASQIPVPKDLVLKQESQFKYIGKSMPRLDIPEKVAGTGVFGLDVQVPDMLYGVMARPPAYGAKPVSYDQKAAEGVKGVKTVVPTPFGIAVCAESLSAGWKGRDALKVKWEKGSHPDLNNASAEKQFMEDINKQGAVAANTGDARKALGEASKKYAATYFVPYVAHTTMEPMNCTAFVQKDRCDVWVPTQGQTDAQGVASQVSGIPPEKVHIHTTLLGGGFGRRAAPDFVVEAVIASKASGKPVKMVWTREEDIKNDFYRAATCQRIEAGFDNQGRLTAWSHKVVAPSLLKTINPKAIINGVDFMTLWGLADFPGSPDNNRIMYEIPNLYIEYLMSDLPIPVAPWRSVQNGPNAYVIECFVDELAHEAGKDPLEFRLQLLKNTMRPRRALETVAEKAGWGKPLPKGKGRGIAQHTSFGSSIAQVAEISVNEGSGAVKVDRVVVAVDCGQVINPDTIAAQIEGAVIMGISTALKEQVKFANGGPQSANFDDYKIIRMSEVPEIEVHIVKSKDAMGGIGEPGVPSAAPAVANAFFNATGVRVRRLPLDPETVREAMKKKA